MPQTILPTSLVGSYAQPDWLIDREKLAGAFRRACAPANCGGWRRNGSTRRRTTRPCSRSAIRSGPGLDIITDGEMRRESYSNRFATALEGVDIDNPGTALDRSGHPNPVPRVTGKVRRKHPVEVRDVEFLRANTDRKIKMTVPGPFTMSQQAQNDFYDDEEETGARLCRRGQCRDQGPVRGRRRHRADRRALHAGASGKGAQVRAQGLQSRARRRRQARPRCISVSAMRRSSMCGRRAIRSCRNSRIPRCGRCRSRPRNRGSIVRC